MSDKGFQVISGFELNNNYCKTIGVHDLLYPMITLFTEQSAQKYPEAISCTHSQMWGAIGVRDHAQHINLR